MHLAWLQRRQDDTASPGNSNFEKKPKQGKGILREKREKF